MICADTDPANFVTSLKSNDSGELLAVGMNKGWKVCFDSFTSCKDIFIFAFFCLQTLS